MAELVALGLEVLAVVLRRRHLDRHPLDDAQLVPGQADHLPGVVRQQADVAHAQVVEDLRPDAEVPQVGGEPEPAVGFDRVIAQGLECPQANMQSDLGGLDPLFCDLSQNVFTEMQTCRGGRYAA